MRIATREEGALTVVEVAGRLDAATAPEFEQRCAASIDGGCHRIILDFAALEYISSAGLRSILTTAKRLKNLGGGIAVYGLAGVVKEVFAISGFDALMPSTGTFEEARKAI
jgi:anti-anti-sigma factor